MRLAARLLLLLLGLQACEDDAADTPGEDCRRAEHACAAGYTCAPVGDGFGCIPRRDGAGAPDVRSAPDTLEPDTGAPDAASGGQDALPVDAAAVDGTPGDDARADLGPDAQKSTDGPLADGAGSDDPVADGPQPDLPVPDMAPPPDPDMAPPPDPDMAPPAPDAGPMPWGPGVCNHGRRIAGDDRLDPNQDVPGARDIQPGFYEDLVIHGDEADWYRLDVCSGGRISVEIDHPFDGGDLDLQVFVHNGGRVIHSEGFCTGEEAGSHLNDTDGGVQYDIGVYVFGPPGQPGGDNNYALRVTVEGC